MSSCEYEAFHLRAGRGSERAMREVHEMNYNNQII